MESPSEKTLFGKFPNNDKDEKDRNSPEDYNYSLTGVQTPRRGRENGYSSISDDEYSEDTSDRTLPVIQNYMNSLKKTRRVANSAEV